MPSGPKRIRRPLLALIALIVALIVGYVVAAATDKDDGSSAPSPTITSSASTAQTPGGSRSTVPAQGTPLSSLPPQAADTVELIRAGGPFPYPRNDGVVFHNNGRVLPAHDAGWYHEYTVPTPGSDTRGARRIVIGKDGTLYYTADHYESFVVVDVTR